MQTNIVIPNHIILLRLIIKLTSSLLTYLYLNILCNARCHVGTKYIGLCLVRYVHIKFKVLVFVNTYF